MISIVLYGIVVLLVIYIIVSIARTRRFKTGDAIAFWGIVVSIILAQRTPFPFNFPPPTDNATSIPISTATDNSFSIPATTSTTWIDNFDGSAINTRWTWVGEDPTHWSLIARLGFLRIVTSRNSSVGVPKNILVQSMPLNDFAIQTLLTFKPTQDGHFAGLLIMQDANNFLKLGRTNNSGQDSLVFWLKEQGNWSDTGMPSIQPTQDDYYLQIVSHGRSYSGSISTNGKDWQSLGTLTINFTPTVIGLLAIDESAGLEEIPADFDFFKLIGN